MCSSLFFLLLTSSCPVIDVSDQLNSSKNPLADCERSVPKNGGMKYILEAHPVDTDSTLSGGIVGRNLHVSIKRYILTLFWGKAVSCNHSLVFQVMSTCIFCIYSYLIVWGGYLSHQSPTCCDHRFLIVSWAEVCALGVSAFPWHRERGDRKSLCLLLLLHQLVSLCHQSDSLSGVCGAIMDLPSLGHRTFPQQPSSALSEPSRAAPVRARVLFFFLLLLHSVKVKTKRLTWMSCFHKGIVVNALLHLL